MMHKLLVFAALATLLFADVSAEAASPDASTGHCSSSSSSGNSGSSSSSGHSGSSSSTPIQNWVPFSVRCAGKSECGPADVIEVRAESSDSLPLKQAYITLVSGSDELECTKSDFNITESEKPTAAQVVANYPLAPNLAEWIQASDNNPHRGALLKATNAKVKAFVSLITIDNHPYKVPLLLDLTSLWANGVLGLQIGKVCCDDLCNQDSAAPSCKFGSTVTLDVPQWPTWALAAKGLPIKLNLYLDGVKLPEVTATPIAAGGENSPARLAFTLRRIADKPESVTAWSTVMHKALNQSGENAKFSVGIGDERGILATKDRVISIESHFDNRGTWTFVILLALVVLLGFGGHLTGWVWIRDSYPIPEGLVNENKRSFSLGRIQMLWWTLIIGTSMGWVWVSTGELWALNETSMVLIGLSTATAVGALAVTPSSLAKLKSELDDADAKGDTTVSDNIKTQLKKEIETQGPWKDISRNFKDTSLGLHRFQNIAFTFLLGLWFLYETFNYGTMPSLSATLLALMGISGSTYVGFKAASN